MSHPLHQFTYCPKCGARTFVERNEKAKQCTTCGFVYYFNPSSAVACFIRNSKGELLLVRRAKEPAKGTLDLPGGFVDMYESAEDAAHREVKEETGLDVTNITYFGNQAWPYPSGLMVGFIADYAGGEIRLQEEELSSGDFYTRDNLPELPRKLSLARKMIDWWNALTNNRLWKTSSKVSGNIIRYRTVLWRFFSVTWKSWNFLKNTY